LGCDGVAFSGKVEDVCGVCDGDGSSCVGCDGVPNSNLRLDECGVCGGWGDSCRGCDGVMGSGKVFDFCGVCDGNGNLPAEPLKEYLTNNNQNHLGLTCSGGSNNCTAQGKVLDACGVCGGDSSSCRGLSPLPLLVHLALLFLLPLFSLKDAMGFLILARWLTNVEFAEERILAWAVMGWFILLNASEEGKFSKHNDFSGFRFPTRTWMFVTSAEEMAPHAKVISCR